MDNRDVAQLVAHYVRDVGVGRSSRLIPTNGSGPVVSVSAKALIDSSLCCVMKIVTTTQVGQKWDSPELSHLLLRRCEILIQNKV